MKYVELKKLPKDCHCIDAYLFPFKLSGKTLYVYQPGVNCYGDAVWYRWTLNASSALGDRLSNYINN